MNSTLERPCFALVMTGKLSTSFTGSDVSLTTHFTEHFGPTTHIYLDKTFRFNNRIEGVASRFVQQNPEQLRKTLITHSHSEESEVHILHGSTEDVLQESLTAIRARDPNTTSILVLARYKHTLDNVEGVFSTASGYTPKAMTLHGSKGKQADYVVILEVIDGAFGFPARRPEDPILDILKPPLETFPDAEERRLFYVGLTRARHRVYIHTEMGLESSFLHELVHGDYEVVSEEAPLQTRFFEEARCPECHVGRLLPREGRYGLYYVCSTNYRYCDVKIKPCPKCQQAPYLNDTLRFYCADPTCGHTEKRCPECGTGRLVQRDSPYEGKFWGCTNYRGDQPGSCTYKRPLNPYKRKKKYRARY